MRVAAAVALSVWVGAPARADDRPSLHMRAEGDHAGTDAVLRTDPVAPPLAAGLGATEDTHRTTLGLGTRGWAELEGTSWTTDVDADDEARGFSLGARTAFDVGWFQLGAGAFFHHDEGRYQHGDRVDVGVSIGTSKQLSRWTKAWISLDAGMRHWIGEPPAGEADGAQILLSLGFTF